MTRARARVTLSLAAASFVVARALFVLEPSVFEAWNARVSDRWFQLRESLPRFRPADDDTVFHIDLNSSSLRELDTFYVTRRHYARLVRNLSAAGIAAQAYDMIFAARQDPEEDRELIEATRQAGNVYYGMAFQRAERESHPNQSSATEPEAFRRFDWQLPPTNAAPTLEVSDPLWTFPDLAAAARGVGALNLGPDADGVVRRIPLLLRHGNQLIPTLALRLACDYLRVSPQRVLVKPGTITLPGAMRPGWETPRDIAIPVDADGRLIINFPGSWEKLKHYRFADVWRASDDPDELERYRRAFAGRIAIVAATATGQSDVAPVPTDSRMPLAGAHAAVLLNIVTGTFVRDAGMPIMLAAELALAFVMILLSLATRPIVFVVGAVAIQMLYVAAAALMFLEQGVLVNTVRPLIMMTVGTVAIAAYHYFDEQRERAALRRTFAAYFPPALVDKFAAQPAVILGAGEKKELTVLFSDIAGFTSRSASKSPDEVRSFLNEYFEAMVAIAFDEGGTVDKFIGDGLMVFFGDPVAQSDHALRAVTAAIRMQHEVQRLGPRLAAPGEPPLAIRIGVSTGPMIVGNMGSSQRLSYTVLGAAVNLAQRLEANAPVGGILISSRTNELVQSRLRTIAKGAIPIKGLAPTPVFEVDLSETLSGS